MKDKSKKLIVVAACFALLLLTIASCSLDTPSKPAHDNPWDPANPSAPRAPEGLAGEVLTETTISLHWQDKSGNEEGFIIEEAYFDSLSLPTWKVVDSVGVDVDSLFISDCRPATSYLFQVSAINDAGRSAPKPPLKLSTFDVRPTAPKDLSIATVDGASLLLTWSDCSANEERFEIFTSSDSLLNFTVLTTPTDSNRTSVVGLDPFQMVYFKVRAVNQFGESDFSALSSGIPGQIPLVAPTDLIASAISETSIHLEWTDPNITTELIDIWESIEDTLHYTLIGSVLQGVTSQEFSNRIPNAVYYYHLIARNRFGASPVSQVARVSTAEVIPFPPTNLQISLHNELDLTLTWEDHSNIETGFELQKGINADSVYLPDGDTLAPNMTTYHQPDNEPFVRLYFRVRAFSPGGSSIWTPSAWIIPGSVAPYAPMGVSAQALSPTSVRVTWNDLSRIEERFDIGKSSGGNWDVTGTADPNSQEYLVNNLSPNTTYTFRVHSVNRYGASVWVSSEQVTTPGPPPSPRAMLAEGISTSEIRLTWQMDQTRHNGFIVEEMREGGDWTVSGDSIKNPDQREYVRSNCARFTRYYFKVKAFNEYGESLYSPIVNAQVRTLVAFVAANSNGVDAVDITDPANPTRIGNTAIDGLAQRVTIVGNLAYVPANYGGVQLLDITSPENVNPITAFDTEGRAYQVAVNGQVVYCADGDSGITILQYDNLNTLTELSVLSTWPGSVRGLIYLNGNLYVAAQSRGVLRVNVSNPRSPAIQQEAATGSTAMSLCQLGTSAQLLSAEYAGFRVLAVPSLAETASISTQFATEIVDKDGSTAYLGQFGRGIAIVDVRTPNNPEILPELIWTADDVWGLVVSGDYLLAAVDNSGLIIYDISSPRSPREIGSFNTTGPARGVGVKEYK